MSLFSKIKTISKVIKKELRLYRNIYHDTRTPWLAKWCFKLAIIYLLSPVDIIPDWIPIIGHLDDIFIVPVLVYMGIHLTPNFIIEEHRARLG